MKPLKPIEDIVLSTRKNGPAILIALGMFLVWEYLSRAELISKIFFPAPSKIFSYFLTMLMDGELLVATGASLGRLCAGFLVGAIPGLFLGLAMGLSRRLQNIVDPFIAALYPIPKIAIFPFIMFIFGIGDLSKIFAIAITAFFPLLINTIAGVREINPVYLEVARNFGASRWNTLVKVILPGSLPMILAGVRIAINTSLMIVIAVELLVARTGLGVIIWFGWETLNILELYAALIMTALIGIGFNILLHWLSERLAPWNFYLDSEEKK
jgi:NitT/TauT family transport system permease protein